jgi:S1-C subfamily serine protease
MDRQTRAAFIIVAVMLAIALLCKCAGAGEPVLVRDWTLSGSTKNISWGSGFGVGGVVVTAAHVVKGGTLEVKTANGWKKVTVLTRDDDLDLAVLTSPGDLDEYSLAEKAAATDQFLIQGFPLGERKTIKASAIEKHGGNVVLDARGMDHGFSGAPVVDSRGCVVGVAVSGLVADEGGGDMDHRRAIAVPLDADRKSTRLNSSHHQVSRMPSSA